MAKFNGILHLAMASVVAVSSLTACNDSNSDPYDNQNGNVAIVTYTGNTDRVLESGMHVTVSTFEFYGTDNTVASSYTTPETTLTGNNYRSGQRMVITYVHSTSGVLYPQGEINLKRAVAVPTATVTFDSHDKAIANNAEIPLYYENRLPSINRTGNYINLQFYLEFYEGREFSVVADESTLETSVPELYVSTTTKGTGSGVSAVSLASLDISAVWNNPAYTGVRVHINNTSGDRQEIFEFNK